MQTRTQPLWLSRAPTMPAALRKAAGAAAYIAIAAGLSIQGMMVRPVEPVPIPAVSRSGERALRGLKAWSWELAEDDESFPARYEPRVPLAAVATPFQV